MYVPIVNSSVHAIILEINPLVENNKKEIRTEFITNSFRVSYVKPVDVVDISRLWVGNYFTSRKKNTHTHNTHTFQLIYKTSRNLKTHSPV